MLKWRLSNLRTMKEEHLSNIRTGVGSRIAHESWIAQIDFEIRELRRQIEEETNA